MSRFFLSERDEPRSDPEDKPSRGERDRETKKRRKGHRPPAGEPSHHEGHQRPPVHPEGPHEHHEPPEPTAG